MVLPQQSAGEARLLKAILQESLTEVLVFDAASLQILQANPAALHNLQIPMRDLQNQTPLDFLDSPDDAQELRILLSLLASGKRRRVSLEVSCRRRDGSTYPVEARLFRSMHEGKPIYICIANDVSQREATRRALEHTESDLRAIMANLPGMAYQMMRQPDGTLTMHYVSHQSRQLLGLRAATLRAHPELFQQLILPEDRADYQARLVEAGGAHLTFNWEGRLWADGWKDVKWVDLRVSPRDTDTGPVWDGILLNVSHGKRAEAEIKRSRAQVSALASHVESVREQERLAIAREIHDDLGGNLTGIKIGLSWLLQHLPPDASQLVERARWLDTLVDQTLDSANRITTDLRPAIIDFGVVAAIEWQLQRFSRNTDIAYDFTTTHQQITLTPEIQIGIFRITQEALTNVAKHAHASQIKVRLERQPDRLTLRIIDDGVGVASLFDKTRFDNTQRRKRAVHGFGILGMTERAAALGGELTLSPGKTRGTEVRLRIPLAPSSLPTPSQLKDSAS